MTTEKRLQILQGGLVFVHEPASRIVPRFTLLTGFEPEDKCIAAYRPAKRKQRQYWYDFYVDPNGDAWRWPHAAHAWRQREWFKTSDEFAKLMRLAAFPLTI